jgi:electron transport complex protein RnfD
MLDVLVALSAPLTAAIWYFGFNALLLSALSVCFCMLLEYTWNLISKKQSLREDFSAAVTGLIIALMLPVTTPVWAILLADAFAIIAVKEFFGGIGQNIFNPAAAGRVFLILFAPTTVIRYIEPYQTKLVGFKADAVTSATLLAEGGAGGDGIGFFRMFSGDRAGSMGETCAAALLLGFGYLFVRGVVKLHAPLSMLAALALLSFTFGGDNGMFSGDAVSALLSGGALFAAFFMTTDYSSTPTTNTGRIIFGVGVGAITFLLRRYGKFDEGVAFALLIMNFLSPLIEELTRRRVYGKRAAPVQESGVTL